MVSVLSIIVIVLAGWIVALRRTRQMRDAALALAREEQRRLAQRLAERPSVAEQQSHAMADPLLKLNADVAMGAVHQAAQEQALASMDAERTRVIALASHSEELEEMRQVLLSILEDTNAAKTEVERREQELKNTQAMLIQAGKLTAMGQLGAGIAHELNQPIAAINGFAQLMLSRLPAASPLAPNLQLIEQQSLRMAKIVDNIRTFAREGKGEREPVNVNEAIEDALLLIATQLKNHSIAVEQRMDPQLPAVLADKNQLQQVFVNLLMNARDAIEERGANVGGQIQLTTTARNGFVEAQIRDTGVGIPPDIRERIFDPFFTTKPPGKGTGLGLSILYGIIEQHHGRITVESTRGEGATFIVRLPLASAQERQTGGTAHETIENLSR